MISNNNATESLDYFIQTTTSLRHSHSLATQSNLSQELPLCLKIVALTVNVWHIRSLQSASGKKAPLVASADVTVNTIDEAGIVLKPNSLFLSSYLANGVDVISEVRGNDTEIKWK